MKNLEELFQHELKDIYDAEHRFRDALEEMSEHVKEPALRIGFTEHMSQTEGQIARLEQVFEALGMEPERATCAGALGLVEEHDTFMEEEPAQEVIEVFHVSAGIKAERYEVTAYEGLVSLANQLGHVDAAELLAENLNEEQQMLAKLLDVQRMIAQRQAAR